MGGLTGVTVRRGRDPRSDRPRPLRVGIKRRAVAVDRFVTEVVLGDGEVVGVRGWRPAQLTVVASPAPERGPGAGGDGLPRAA